MNANELADEFSKTTGGAGNIYQQAATMLRKQAEEIEYWKDKFDRAMEMQTQKTKSAKYSDEWWKEVAEFNKQLKEQNEQ
jgi:biotin carboxylase